jgi:uncharacterized protein YndB with AHSA1/START domain
MAECRDMTDTPAAQPTSGSELTAAITINATPAQVWAAVTDVARMSAWSPQVRKTVVKGGAVGPGTRFSNINHDGWKRWPTTAQVVRFTPETDFAFRIKENRTVWSFQLQEVEGGTRVTQRRETPDGVAAISRFLVAIALGGQKSFTKDMQAGMERTLGRLKAELEA